MRQTRTPREWFNTYVDKGKLFDMIIKAVEDAVHKDSVDIDNERYLGLVHDVVNSGNGQYTSFYALEYFDYEDVDTDNIEQYDIGYVIDELDSFTMDLEDIINNEVINGTNISIHFGEWEADGTYCMMCSIDKGDYRDDLEIF